MTDPQNTPEWPGDPRHPEHDSWLRALGQVTYASARLTGGIINILRIHGGEDWLALNRPPLGPLINQLKDAHLDLEGMDNLVQQAKAALRVRNDVMHALPVAHGLHRRKADDAYYVQEYYDVESLEAAVNVIDSASRLANKVLYSKGKAVIEQYGR